MPETQSHPLDDIEPGDLVRYHGPQLDAHGLYLALPYDDPHAGTVYMLFDPFQADSNGDPRIVIDSAPRSTLTPTA